MKSREDLQQALDETKRQIEKLQPSGNSYTDQVARSFPLGRVGGSGRRTGSLNRRRERELDKTIDTAVKLVPLYKLRDELTKAIEDYDSGKTAERAEKRRQKILLWAEIWKNIKVGDEIALPLSNNTAIVTKKNAKSLETGAGCKWTAAEIIGKESAKLL